MIAQSNLSHICVSHRYCPLCYLHTHTNREAGGGGGGGMCSLLACYQHYNAQEIYIHKCLHLWLHTHVCVFTTNNVCVVYCHGFRKPRATVAECKLHILGCALIRIPFIRSCLVLLHTYVISITPRCTTNSEYAHPGMPWSHVADFKITDTQMAIRPQAFIGLL